MTDWYQFFDSVFGHDPITSAYHKYLDKCREAGEIPMLRSVFNDKYRQQFAAFTPKEDHKNAHQHNDSHEDQKASREDEDRDYQERSSGA